MRRMLQDSQGKLGNVRKRIEDLRLEVALSGLPTEQKNNYLRLIELSIFRDNSKAMQQNYKKLLSIAPFGEDSMLAKELIRKYSE